MAYPMAQALRYDDFCERLKSEFGVSIETAGVITGPRGDTRLQHFVRVLPDSPPLRWPTPNLGSDDRVQWDVLRSICRALKVPVEPFGLTLG